MVAFEECLEATSTNEAPWYVIPADDKENTRLKKMSYPETDLKRREELQQIRTTLVE